VTTSDPTQFSTGTPSLDTLAIRAGRPDSALAPTLVPSTTWQNASLADARKGATRPRSDRFYARYSNPTVRAFEDAIAEMEGAEEGLAFGSGQGAVATVVLALCSSGDHIVAQRQLFSGTQLFLQSMSRFGIEVTFVDGTSPAEFENAVVAGRTMMVLAETPANPQLALVDLERLGAIKGPIKVVDSTLATPIFQQPLRFGIDIVLHSATKGIAGHNDATLGVIAAERDLINSIWSYSVLHGSVASPFDAMNGLRGLRTLPVRVRRQADTAMQLACYLERSGLAARVNYPGLSSHPQFALAQKQMRGFGSVLSVDLAGGAEAARKFCEGVQLARMATSLGGPETLVTCPALTTHAGLSPEEMASCDITPGLVRISVGLEHPDDLLADFAQALR
jgi:cystathionine beta-lyase/cystathionine gamma-synthase